MSLGTSFDLTDRTALVTGGARGMGRMLAEGLLHAGATVFITAREGAAEAAKEMAAIGPCTGLIANLADAGATLALARQMSEHTAWLNILVNNAGKTWGAPLETFPDKAWPSVLAVNVQAPFALIRDLLPLLRVAGEPDNPARVINIGSLAGHAVERLDAYSYAASKAALHHLSRELAATLAADHITVNTIAPGYFPTGMTAHIRADDARADALAARVPLGRLGRAADIAGACVFLASPAGSYVTGITLPVDGGLSGCR